MFFSDMSLQIYRKEKKALPKIKKYHHETYLERTFLFISGKASLTIEAACVLPLFLYAVLAFMYFFSAINITEAVSAGILETGKELAVSAYARESLGDENDSNISHLVRGNLSFVYARQNIIKKIEETGADISLLKNGTDGIGMLKSSILEEDDIIDLVVSYQLKFPIPILVITEISVEQRGYFRAWTGIDRQPEENHSDDDAQVYITVNGRVYHRDRDCTHIRLSVSQVHMSTISQLRNKSGAKYYECERCERSNTDQVYITETGDRYHGSVNCSGLKRQVLTVPESQIGGRDPCSRCGE